MTPCFKKFLILVPPPFFPKCSISNRISAVAIKTVIYTPHLHTQAGGKVIGVGVHILILFVCTV